MLVSAPLEMLSSCRGSRSLAMGFIAVLLLVACDSGGRPQQLAHATPRDPGGSPPSIEVTHGTLTALDASTGRQLWSANLPMGAVNPPVTVAGMVMVAGGDNCQTHTGEVAAFEEETGRPRWTLPISLGSFCFATVSAASASVVAAAPRGPTNRGQSAAAEIEAIDARSGRVMWMAPGDQAVAANDIAVVQLRQPGPGAAPKIEGLDVKSGRLVWSAGGIPMDAPLVVDAGRAYLIGSAPPPPGQQVVLTRITALDVSTGQIEWQKDEQNAADVGLPVVGDVIVQSGSRQTIATPAVPPVVVKPQPQWTWKTSVVARDPATGKEAWRQDETGTGNSPGPAGVVETAGTVYLERFINAAAPGTQQSSCVLRIDALDPQTGARRWRIDQTGGCIPGPGTMAVSPAVAIVAIGGASSQLVALAPGSGKELWRRPVQLPAGSLGFRVSIHGSVVHVAAAGRFIPEQGD